MVSFYKSEILCLKIIKQAHKTFSGGKIMEAISQPYMEIMYIYTITLSEINKYMQMITIFLYYSFMQCTTVLISSGGHEKAFNWSLGLTCVAPRLWMQVQKTAEIMTSCPTLPLDQLSLVLNKLPFPRTAWHFMCGFNQHPHSLLSHKKYLTWFNIFTSCSCSNFGGGGVWIN